MFSFRFPSLGCLQPGLKSNNALGAPAELFARKRPSDSIMHHPIPLPTLFIPNPDSNIPNVPDHWRLRKALAPTTSSQKIATKHNQQQVKQTV